MGGGIAQADRGGVANVTNNYYNGMPTAKQPEAVPIIHLPQRKPLFIGRETEIETLRLQLQEPGSLAYISGVAGRGKTSLALEYAHRYMGGFDSVHWLPCEKRSLVDIASELARQLDLKRDGEPDAIVRGINDHCAHNRCLLVFDSVENDIPAPLTVPGKSSVLITTRLNTLPFLREHQPLKLPLFTEEQCFALFRARLGTEEVDKHEAAAKSLFSRLGYLPIPIAVAASLIFEDPGLTIEAMASNPPKDTYAMLREAVAALSPPAQTLLAAMAVCAAAGFRLPLAAPICELDREPSSAAVKEVFALNLAELLDRDVQRYRLPALVREAAGANDALHRKHSEVMRDEFKNWETEWRTCEADVADGRAAVAWLLSQPEDEAWQTANEMAYRGYLLADRLGRLSEAYEMCERMSKEADKRKDSGRLGVWYGCQGIILRAWGRLEEAMALHQKEEAICLDLGNKD